MTMGDAHPGRHDPADPADPALRRPRDPDEAPRVRREHPVAPPAGQGPRPGASGLPPRTDAATENPIAVLAKRLRMGRCIPFLGAGASLPTFPLGSSMARRWAAEHDYPFDDDWNLPQVMQYVATRFEDDDARDALWVKEEICEQLFGGDQPRPHLIHKVLAEFPIRTYVTTNYDDLMHRALEEARKRPRREMSLWYDEAPRRVADDWEPTAAEPLVFHLHGHHSKPPSLVLTQDDYVEYLVKLVEERGKGNTRTNAPMLPYDIGPKMRDSHLLFIGYSMEDWTFKVLFRALTHGRPSEQLRRHVSVQVEPAHFRPDGSTKNYIERYFRAKKITIFWEEADAFAQRLSDHLRGGGSDRTDQ